MTNEWREKWGWRGVFISPKWGVSQTSDPLCWKLNPVLHTISTLTGFSVSPGCREVFTWRLEAFPLAWSGSPGWCKPLAQGLAAGGAGRRRETGSGASPGSPRGSKYGTACQEQLWGHARLRPPASGPPPPNPPPGLKGQRHQGNQTRLLKAKEPEGGRDPPWATHQIEGSFHYFHRPRRERWPEEGERRRRSTWRTAGKRKAATETAAPLRVRGAGRQPSQQQEQQPHHFLLRRRGPRPLRRGHARVTTSHAVAQGGSEDGLWVGLREGGWPADVHFLAIFSPARS